MRHANRKSTRESISKPDKVLFPADGLTKTDLADYYQRIAPYLLPQTDRRPLTVRRFPDGIGEEGFFQKNKPDHYPTWIESVVLPKEGGSVEYMLAQDSDTLIYLADQAAIELHIALSRVEAPNQPDRLVFDLDPPADNVDFQAVVYAARKLRDHLLDLDLQPFVQTTGSRGLHVVVPIRPELTFDEVRGFAQRVGDRLADEHNELLTTEHRKSKRRGRIYIDVLRNAYGQTHVAPYSVRARPGAPIATPLAWHELGQLATNGTDAQTYRIKNIFRRLGQKQCPWSNMASVRQRLSRVV